MPAADGSVQNKLVMRFMVMILKKQKQKQTKLNKQKKKKKKKKKDNKLQLKQLRKHVKMIMIRQITR